MLLAPRPLAASLQLDELDDGAQPADEESDNTLDNDDQLSIRSRLIVYFIFATNHLTFGFILYIKM